MKFKGWEKTSLIEYHGKISTILFTGGCNFRCPFCYNRELVLHPERVKDIEGGDVLRFLEENRYLYQAVMVTGGEPTMHANLPAFFAEVKRLGLLAGLETNGTNPAMLDRLLGKGLLDFVAMDIKAPLKRERYEKAAGVKNGDVLKNVRKSVRILMEKAPDYEFRTTVVPGLHDGSDIAEIAGQLKGARKYVLQQFSPTNTLDGRMLELKPLPREELFEMGKKIRKNFGTFEIRNV